MSVKVRLNNREFFGGPFVIGGRLYEADAMVQQPATLADANTSANNQEQKPDLALQVQGIITEGYGAMVNTIAQKLQQIQGQKWPQVPLVQGSAEEVLKAVQGYLQGIVNVVKEAAGQQLTNSTAQATPAAGQPQAAAPAQNTPGQAAPAAQQPANGQ